jgi:hypothetical protein
MVTMTLKKVWQLSEIPLAQLSVEQSGWLQLAEPLVGISEHLPPK